MYNLQWVTTTTPEALPLAAMHLSHTLLDVIHIPGESFALCTANPIPSPNLNSELQVVARIGKLRVLNGSSISLNERKEAELQYLREIAGGSLFCVLSKTLTWGGGVQHGMLRWGRRESSRHPPHLLRRPQLLTADHSSPRTLNLQDEILRGQGGASRSSAGRMEGR